MAMNLLFFQVILISALASSMLPGGGGTRSGEAEGGAGLRHAPAAQHSDRYYSIIPLTYCCLKATGTITIDGLMNEADWRRAAWTSDFMNIEGEAAPRHRTRMKMLWDENYLYVYAEMQEPHVRATETQRDGSVYQDSHFGFLLSPGDSNHDYYEAGINALNAVWDSYFPKALRDGGRNEPQWDISGLRSAITIQGTLNDASNIDTGWSLELALPWSAFNRHGVQGTPVVAGRTWRMNFWRAQWQHEIVDGEDLKTPGAREEYWIWSPHGVFDLHTPEKWGWVRFVDAEARCSDLAPDAYYQYVMALHRVYWAQKRFHARNRRWARDFNELGMTEQSLRIEQRLPQLTQTHLGFTVEYSILTGESVDSRSWLLLGINQEAKLTRTPAFDKIVR
jgi:hypothetical protein